MKTVALFTTFYECKSGYSLVAVTETQINMLLDGGYDPIVLVQENFTSGSSPWNNHTVDLRKVIPSFPLVPSIHKDFDERANQVYNALCENLNGIDVVLTHDIIFQEFYKEHNIAVRQYAKENPDILWLNWIHSRPIPKNIDTYPESCRFTPPPGYIIYPNSSDTPFVWRAYRLEGQEHKVIVNRASHSLDTLKLWNYDKLTKDLVKKSDLLNGDIVCIYPVRLDKGKQVEKLVYLMSGIEKSGYDPRLLVVDWQSAGIRFQKRIEEILTLSQSLGIKDKVNFTSRLDDRCSQGIPHNVVIELLDLSNVFINASKTETYSLIVQEAMSRGVLCVLNYDLPMMRELWGDNAIYMDFGSDQVSRKYHPNEKAFWKDESKRMIAELKRNRALMAKTNARKLWTPQVQWREFEPLLYLEPVQ